MFTGIISDTSATKVEDRGQKGLKLTFERPKDWADLKLGESVAVDGICLTVAGLSPTNFDCFVIPETIAKTTFAKKLPERVNLERALKLNDRLSGHFVQGHVDGVGTVTNINKKAGEWRVSIAIEPAFNKFVISKGSITINGVALTIAELAKSILEVALIPFTLEHTTLGTLSPGDQVNLEFDMLGKYVLNSLESQE